VDLRTGAVAGAGDVHVQARGRVVEGVPGRPPDIRRQPGLAWIVRAAGLLGQRVAGDTVGGHAQLAVDVLESVDRGALADVVERPPFLVVPAGRRPLDDIRAGVVGA